MVRSRAPTMPQKTNTTRSRTAESTPNTKVQTEAPCGRFSSPSAVSEASGSGAMPFGRAGAEAPGLELADVVAAWGAVVAPWAGTGVGAAAAGLAGGALAAGIAPGAGVPTTMVTGDGAREAELGPDATGFGMATNTSWVP